MIARNEPIRAPARVVDEVLGHGFESYVATLDIASFGEALSECIDAESISVQRCATEQTNHRYRRLLCSYLNRPPAAPPSSVMNSRRRITLPIYWLPIQGIKQKCATCETGRNDQFALQKS